MENSNQSFNPNDAASSDAGIFGLPYTEDESLIVLLPVPWEVTTSYGDGTSRGPESIRKSSEQVDLFDVELGAIYKSGIYMRDISSEILTKNDNLKTKAKHLEELRCNQTNPDEQTALLNEINVESQNLYKWTYENAKEILSEGKLLGLIGGDHSTPLGGMKAISKHLNGNFGVLHIDAHADLRNAYQGFNHSHASIMRNVMTASWAPQKLVQVGIRDFCEEESEFIKSNPNKIKTFFDHELKEALFEGETWKSVCQRISSELPNNVYISFDIDGLSPDLCPHTGTPVAGGFSMEQIFYLFKIIVSSGKKIIGFDLNEVAQNEWDGNVGARVLYKLCGWLAFSYFKR